MLEQLAQMVRFKDTRYEGGNWTKGLGFAQGQISFSIVGMVNESWLTTRGELEFELGVLLQLHISELFLGVWYVSW